MLTKFLNPTPNAFLFTFRTALRQALRTHICLIPPPKPIVEPKPTRVKVIMTATKGGNSNA
ncbi:hypothetical protein [Rodentibacter haemolyticus]|uniref:Uncharacterized protein n=1 Tax=Rodentibacter haemolyticus TaxID=2778911 RepID=A0ABX6UX39_9PAST|nr:hypothetical protein [Rodentibacter haemolyticus]QPB42670.1 hypothetical protein IHV77_00645 [Rodentibacter haemolyticus]